MFNRMKNNATDTNGSEWSPGSIAISAATSLSRLNTARTENDYEFETAIIAEGSNENTEETAYAVIPISRGQLAEENLHETSVDYDHDNVRDAGVDATDQVTSNQQPQGQPVYAKVNKFSSEQRSDPSSSNMSVSIGNTLIENELYASASDDRSTADNTLIDNELYNAI